VRGAGGDDGAGGGRTAEGEQDEKGGQHEGHALLHVIAEGSAFAVTAHQVRRFGEHIHALEHTKSWHCALSTMSKTGTDPIFRGHIARLCRREGGMNSFTMMPT